MVTEMGEARDSAPRQRAEEVVLLLVRPPVKFCEIVGRRDVVAYERELADLDGAADFFTACAAQRLAWPQALAGWLRTPAHDRPRYLGNVN